MISYANVPLRQATPELQQWAALNVNPQDVALFCRRSWPGPGLEHLTGPPAWPIERVVLSRLTWPTGASRWSTFFGLITGADLEAIRSQVYASGEYQAQDLVFHDGIRSVTASMWMLPAWPLSQIGTEGLALLILVDERYFWHYRAADISVDAGTTTWADLYTQLATGLDITLSVDSVEAAYLKPPKELATPYRSLPLLLDAVAASTGRKIVRQLDGTVRAWNPVNARQSVTDQLPTLPDKQAGGLLALTAGGAA